MHNQPAHKKETIKINIWQIATIALAVLLIASVLTQGFRFLKTSSLSEKEAAELLLSYISENIPGINPVLISTSEESGVYNIILSVDGEEGSTYLTKDGEFIFPAAIPTSQPLTQPNIQDIEINPEELGLVDDTGADAGTN